MNYALHMDKGNIKKIINLSNYKNSNYYNELKLSLTGGFYENK